MRWPGASSSDSVAGRLNLMTHESNVAGRDKVNYDRWGIAPSLAFGLGTPTRVNLDYYHLESDDLPDSGIPYTIPTNGSAGRTSAPRGSIRQSPVPSLKRSQASLLPLSRVRQLRLLPLERYSSIR